ncbi:hypothetical protein ACFQ1I_33295 [Kitasatospora arboriphila]
MSTRSARDRRATGALHRIDRRDGPGHSARTDPKELPCVRHSPHWPPQASSSSAASPPHRRRAPRARTGAAAAWSTPTTSRPTTAPAPSTASCTSTTAAPTAARTARPPSTPTSPRASPSTRPCTSGAAWLGTKAGEFCDYDQSDHNSGTFAWYASPARITGTANRCIMVYGRVDDPNNSKVAEKSTLASHCG